MHKTLYLWDMSNTIFHEKWNVEKTGYPDYQAFVAAKLNKPVEKMTPREYESGYDEAYLKGWYFDLKLNPGAEEALKFCEHNETFSTSPPEHLDYRDQYLNPKLGFKIKDFFQKINSTFDYGETNVKTEEMYLDYLNKKYDQGYKTVVYTDDKLENIQEFKKAVKKFRQNYQDFNYRLYHILNNQSSLMNKGDYLTVGSLFDLMDNEKNSNK